MSDIRNITKLWPVYGLEQIDENAWSKTYRVQEVDDHKQARTGMVKSIPIPSEYFVKMNGNRREYDDYMQNYCGNLVEKILTHIAEMDCLKTHSNCVKIVDYAVENRPNNEGYIIYIKMDAMESLQHLVKNGKLTSWDSIKVGCEICDLLEECEKNGISHGAITMDNIYRSTQNLFQLGEFGFERTLLEAHMLEGKVQDDLQALGHVLKQISKSVPTGSGLQKIIQKACGKESEHYTRAGELKKDLLASLSQTEETEVVDHSIVEDKEKVNSNSKKSNEKKTIKEKPKTPKRINVKAIAGIALLVVVGVGIAFAGNRMGLPGIGKKTSSIEKKQNKYYKQGYELCYSDDESKRNLKEAVAAFEKGAAEDDADSAWMLVRMYRHGQGVKPDRDQADEYEKKAYKIYSKEAKNGDVNAMSWMSDYLEKGGICAAADKGKAEEWEKKTFDAYEKAAKDGDAKAMSSLAYAYRYGEGTEKDTDKAIEWYEKSIEAGNDDALELLASLYRYDEGKYRDRKKAIALYKEAEEKGKPSAAESLAFTYEFAGIDGEAFKYYEKAAEKNYGYAMSSLGLQYSFMDSLNPKKADYWRKKDFEMTKVQAENGDTSCMEQLARMYEEGKGVEKDAGKAQEWREKVNNIYKTIFEQGDADFYLVNTSYMDQLDNHDKKAIYDKILQESKSPSLLHSAAIFYFVTYGDVKKAEEVAEMIEDDWYRADVYNVMAQAYDWGREEIKEDKSEALKYYCKAQEIDENDSYLTKRIGDFYHEGEVVPKDDDEAMKWYQKTVDAGDNYSVESMIEIYLDRQENDKAEELAQKFLDQGDPSAYYELGYKYFWDSSRESAEKAANYLEIAANEGHTEAKDRLVALYCGSLNNQEKAKELFEKARADGSTGCVEDYIDYLVKKAKDVDAARKIATDLLEDQNGEGCEQLAKMYEDGDGLPKDQAKADELRKMSKDAGAKLKGDMY